MRQENGDRREREEEKRQEVRQGEDESRRTRTQMEGSESRRKEPMRECAGSGSCGCTPALRYDSQSKQAHRLPSRKADTAYNAASPVETATALGCLLALARGKMDFLGRARVHSFFFLEETLRRGRHPSWHRRLRRAQYVTISVSHGIIGNAITAIPV